MSGRAWLIPVAVVVVVAVAIVALRRPSQPAQSAVSGQTVAVAYGNLQPQVGGTGSIRAASAVTLVAQGSGTLSSLPVAVGEAVDAGQVVATVDDQGASAARVAQAQAALAAAQTQLQQLESPASFVSSDQVKAAQIGVQQAQAALAQAQAVEAQAQTAHNTAVSSETLTSPIDGTIVSLAVSQGQSVTPGAAVATVAPDLNKVQIDAQVLDVNLYNIYVGEEAGALVPAVNTTLGGTVSQIAGQPDRTTAQGNYYDVTIQLGSVTSGPSSTLANQKLQAGMSAYVNLFSNKPGQLPNTPGLIQTQPIPNSSIVVADGVVNYTGAWTVTAPAAGNVATVPVQQWGSVQKGDTLATLTGSGLTAAVQQAEAALATAKAGVASAQAALDAAQAKVQMTEAPAPAPDAQIAAAQAAVQQAQATLQAAQAAAAQLAVKAPFAGVVSATMVTAGAQVAPGTPVLTMVNPTTIQAVIQVPAAQVGLLTTGQSATVTAAGGQTYTGTVAQVSPQGQNLGGATVYPVTLNLAQTDGLKAGMAITATIQVPPIQHVLVVPAAAVSGGTVVVAGAQGSHVQPVTLGTSDGKFVQVIQGLTAGEQVILP